MALIKNKFLIIGFLVFCISVLLFAYFVEHVLKYAPCNLCLIERIPYIAGAILAFFVLAFDKYEKLVLIIIGLFFIFGAVVSFYHFGIEKGFFNESLVCDLSSVSKAKSAQELLKELAAKSVSCKDVAFSIFGLSLATFNTIISFIISAIMLYARLNYEKN